MCYNCGCGNKQDDMGNPDNITEKTMDVLGKDRVLAHLTGKSIDKAIEEAFEKAAAAWGQPVKEAKEETLKLLNK